MKMPTMSEFNAAAKKLESLGFEYRLTMMTDDAKKPGVENFGKLYAKGDVQFWLNFKTIHKLLG